MSNTVNSLGRVMKHVYTEPKFVAQVEWLSEYSVNAQLHRQVPRDEMEQFVATGQHRNPGRYVELTFHQEPDWDWWEPRHDQPWRRQAARDRWLTSG